MLKHSYQQRPLVFLCIGTDRATGDCLGPILGHRLHTDFSSQFHVYGTLEEPVHARNLDSTIAEINSSYDNPLIVAVDAALGKSAHVGFVTLGEGPLKPGAGVEKELPSVGELSITGIVNMSGILDQMLLQTTRLNIVVRLADYIFEGINRIFV